MPSEGAIVIVQLVLLELIEVTSEEPSNNETLATPEGDVPVRVTLAAFVGDPGFTPSIVVEPVAEVPTLKPTVVEPRLALVVGSVVSVALMLMLYDPFENELES